MILTNNTATMNSSGQSNESVSKVCGDLLSSSAWSAVIHQPAHDSDLEDLPSTVDMDAIKDPIQTSHNTITNQVVDFSESESESETESEKEKYCTKKFGYSSVDDDNIDDSSDTSFSSYLPWSKRKGLDKQKRTKDSVESHSHSSSSSSDESSSSSKSAHFPKQPIYDGTSSDGSKKKEFWQEQPKKTFSSSSELDKLENLEPEHLQVINQEDLAEILSDVQNQSFSTGFDDVQPKNLSDSSDSSDIEIKDCVVNDAIIRLNNSSEDENKKPAYSSKLLKDFVEKTESVIQKPNCKNNSHPLENKTVISKQKENVIKRGRGRPKGVNVIKEACATKDDKEITKTQNVLPKLSANFKRGPGRPKKMPPLLEPNSPTTNTFEYEPPKEIKVHKKKKKNKKKKKKRKKTLNPKFIAEMENLVALFIQCLNISKISESIRGKSSSLKSKQRDRSGKKRKIDKTSYSDNDIDKKRKKGSPDTSRDSETTNDQRLPLKKRHYHITSSTGAGVTYVEDVSIGENSGSESDKQIKTVKVKSEVKKKSGLRSNSAIPEVKAKDSEKKDEPKPRKPPAGVFVPTVEMPSLQLKKKVDEINVKKVKLIKPEKDNPIGKLKKRKKCINRTGFPVKKKKKKRTDLMVSDDISIKHKSVDPRPKCEQIEITPERRSIRAVVLNKLKDKKKDEKEDSDASSVSLPKKIKTDPIIEVKSQKKKPDKKHSIQSWNYRKLKTNVYYDFKPICTYEAQACNCVVPTEGKGCTDDCINRMIFAECSPELCPCKEKCSNQRLQTQQWAPGLVKFMTEEKGWGIKTTEEVKSGELLLEYVGEVVSEQTFKDRMTSIYKNDVHHYCLKLDGGSVIDGHRMGGEARFVNHSCEPNCEMQKWSVNGLFRMALFALRKIQHDEELCYDYNFSLFNPDEGQLCKCKSQKCRGVIGGKTQRITIRSPSVAKHLPTNRNRSRKAAPNTNTSPKKSLSIVSIQQKLISNAPIVISQEDKELIFLHKICLYRNLMKIEKIRKKRRGKDNKPKQPEVFRAQMNALTNSCSVRTRRLATAQNDPEMEKKAKLATIFKQLFDIICNAKEETGEILATPFITLPSKRRVPNYYTKISEPIDLTTIANNIEVGVYDTVIGFDSDILKLLTNNMKYYGRTSDLGVISTRLRKIYNLAKIEFVPKIESILEKPIPEAFIAEKNNPGGDQDDVVRCICGLNEEEGLMIQCERCLVWQHCDCIKADPGKVEYYLCERCDRREVDYEIQLPTPPSYAEPSEVHYLTLIREDLQIRVNDTVYVLRDITNPESGKSHSYKTIKNFKYSDCDIFRVERLWKNEAGERFSFGHHYLRPHETYHEPTRKFYPNEVVRVPIYEKISLDLIMGRCWVLDPSTYSKGYPIGSEHKHLYICEYRVDKCARMFAKMNKSKNPPICTKSYAFEKYDKKLKLARTFAPHGLMVKVTNNSTTPRPRHIETIQTSKKLSKAQYSIKKQRLDTLLTKLLSNLPEEEKVDITYLLEPGRRHRKKPSFLEL